MKIFCFSPAFHIYARHAGHKYLWLPFLVLFTIGCKSKNEQKFQLAEAIDSVKIKSALIQIAKAKQTVKTGDLILRTGKDFASSVFKNVSQHDKTYSHCGIASWENDTLFVYHMLGGEWNPDQKMRRDEFLLFCNPWENEGIGIYRYDLDWLQKRHFMNNIVENYRKKIEFDMKFDLNSDDKMYCSELIFKALSNVSAVAADLPISAYQTITYISIDDLYLHKHCREVKRILFK